MRSGFEEAGVCSAGAGVGGGGSDDILFEFSMVWKECQCCCMQRCPHFEWGSGNQVG